MKYEAAIYQMTVETHTFWVAESKVLKGCVGQGDTSESAIKELEQNEIDWIKTAEEVGIQYQKKQHIFRSHSAEKLHCDYLQIFMPKLQNSPKKWISV